jgi:hypothetical protein
MWIAVFAGMNRVGALLLVSASLGLSMSADGARAEEASEPDVTYTPMVWTRPDGSGGPGQAPPAPSPAESSALVATKTGGPSTAGYFTLALGGADLGPMAMANLSFEVRSVLLSARISAASEFALFMPAEGLTEYSFLMGKVWRSGVTRLYAATGIGVADITSRGAPKSTSSDAIVLFQDYDMLNDQAVNIPFQLGLSWDARIAGFGFAVVGNLNRVRSDFGIVFTASLGKMH